MEDYLLIKCRYWLPSASRDVIVGALSYSAIAEALERYSNSDRFRGTCKVDIQSLIKKDNMIIFPCKVLYVTGFFIEIITTEVL